MKTQKKPAGTERRWFQRALAALFAVPGMLLVTLLLLGQREESVAENRTLARFPQLSLSAFLEGSFQDQLEKALGDQLPGAETVKGLVLDGRHALLLSQQLLLGAVHETKSGYTLIADGYYHYGGEENRIVEAAGDYLDRQPQLEDLAARFRGIPDTRLCLYFIENSRVVDFDRPGREDAVWERILTAFAPDAADRFRVPDYETYKDNFYQTDHHWNWRGSYKGYQAITSLLHPGEEETLSVEPAETVELPVVFQGAYARQTHVLCADEPFTFQVFDLPRYRTVIEGKKGTYGHISLYRKGSCPTDELRNHYAYCFGGDFGLIEYDFGDQGRGNLLLVASSYSNPINALIAAGYDHTYVVDLRYYEAWAGAPFDPAAFCREHGVRDILLLGDAEFYFRTEGAEEGTDA